MHAMTFQNISDSFPFQNCYNLWERKPLMSCTYTFIYDNSWKCSLIWGMQVFFLCFCAWLCCSWRNDGKRCREVDTSLSLFHLCVLRVGKPAVWLSLCAFCQSLRTPFLSTCKELDYKVSQLFLKIVSPSPEPLYSSFFYFLELYHCRGT